MNQCDEVKNVKACHEGKLLSKAGSTVVHASGAATPYAMAEDEELCWAG
jgi:hypothetical protein